LLRGSTDATRWLGSVIASSGAVYVAITLGVAFAASDAARYAAHNGTPGTTVAALSNLHWLAVFMATVILGVFTVAVAAAVWTSHLLPRWVAVLGFLAAAACLTAAVNPPENVVDDATLLWMAWFIALGVTALRASRRPALVMTATPAPV
jgi:hypothetical protein